MRQLVQREVDHEEARLLIADGQRPNAFVAVQVVEARGLESAGITGQNDVYAMVTYGQQQYRTHTMKQVQKANFFSKCLTSPSS
jgi:hypothetical protein